MVFRSDLIELIELVNPYNVHKCITSVQLCIGIIYLNSGTVTGYDGGDGSRVLRVCVQMYQQHLLH